ncbi:Uncharacterized protein TCM_011781 [Theobroma cacao]|uniref:Uncharacterized protein n=1 Tax=Theobroma cacao TaxID=3641 RepID=A0A061EAQ7_THECC|nr:Uncharacterized protein TCM_011781 [Theobroma cacao]
MYFDLLSLEAFTMVIAQVNNSGKASTLLQDEVLSYVNGSHLLVVLFVVIGNQAFKHETERLVNELRNSAQYAEDKLVSIQDRTNVLLQKSNQIH